MIIRRAGPPDSGVMGQIWLEASRLDHPFLEEAVLHEELATVQDLYLPQAENWVAEEDCVLGTPAVHRRGGGRRLIEDAAARLGALTVEVYEQNEAAVAFYLDCGFKLSGRKESDDCGRPFALIQMTRDAFPLS